MGSFLVQPLTHFVYSVHFLFVLSCCLNNFLDEIWKDLNGHDSIGNTNGYTELKVVKNQKYKLCLGLFFYYD